jgi:uncharacterized protein DUF2325
MVMSAQPVAIQNVFALRRNPYEGLRVLRPEPMERRAHIWELAPALHCSIVGTCLTTAELRVLVRSADAHAARGLDDHDLHRLAVSSVESREPLSKKINKALDRRHRVAIGRFGKAATAAEVRSCWDDAMRSGDIPGGYWALMTHPRTTDDLVRRAFGDVHMLSHLVGAANRADIQRLRLLEDEKAALEEKLQRQQRRLRDDIVCRDTKIAELTEALGSLLERTQTASSAVPQSGALDHVLAETRKQLDAEVRRRERAERKLAEAIAHRDETERSALTLGQDLVAVREELGAAEAALAALTDRYGDPEGARLDLGRLTVLYVGGRPHQIARFRSLLGRAAAALIHHDGGMEQSIDLLPGLVSRADVAVFPVDTISHDAALAVKRLCRLAEKPYIPLRSSGLASLLCGLKAHAILPAVEAS